MGIVLNVERDTQKPVLNLPLSSTFFSGLHYYQIIPRIFPRLSEIAFIEMMNE